MNINVINYLLLKLILMSSILFNVYIINNSSLYAAENFTIKKIIFEGLQRISTNEAMSNVPLHINEKITTNDIAHTIKMLFSTGNFESIQILKDRDTIIIRVKEYPLISHITFHGNRTIKKDILINNLKLQGLEEGKLFNEKCIFKIKEALKNFYCDIGQYATKIKIIITTLPNNQVDIKIIFNENRATNVKKINIIGNQQFSTNKLLNLFQLHNRFPRKIIFKKKYNKNSFLKDIKILNSFYINKGFAKFKINSTQIQLTPNKKDVYLSIYITEGLQYKISNIIINGNLSNFSHEIRTLCRIYPNEIYNNQKIQDSIQNIKNFLGNYGYIHPNIITDIETDDVNKTLKLYIDIDIGKRFYVNKIKFIGNNITQDTVLRREIRQMEKTWVNNKFLHQSQERLNRIGYFEYVKIKKEYLSKYPDQINIIYKVKENNSGNMNISLGIGTESGINFQTGIQQANLFGSGNSFMLSATKNYYQTYTELSSTQPYFIKSNINLEETIFYNNFTENNTDLSDYGLKNYGIKFNMGFPISEHNILNLNLNYIHNNLHNIKPQIVIWRYLNSQNIYPKLILNNKILNFKKETNNITHFNSNDLFLGTSWKRNNLNHFYFPTYGSYLDCSGKITIPGSNNEYYKITINSNHYIPLYKKNPNHWILMGYIHGGYSTGLHKKENPFYDNFYSSGINTVRGFRPNTIGPKAAYYKCSSNDQKYDTCVIQNSKDAIGGNAIIIIKGELIIPTLLFDKKYQDIIRTSIFIDLGTIWDTHWKNTLATQIANIPNYKNPYNIRISNGIAVQWISPIGPVVFSYAKLIKKYTEDKREQFQFNIGKTW